MMSYRMCAALAAATLASGCHAHDAHEPEGVTELLSEDEAGAAEALARVGETWRPHVASEDPMLRAAAATAIAADPGEDGMGALHDLVGDAHPSVRERAMSTLAQLAGIAAAPQLRQVALSDPERAVASYAEALLYRVRQEANEPPRGFIAVEDPGVFEVGQPFELRVRVGATEAVPRARLGVKLPRGLELLSPSEPGWRGALAAHDDREVVIVVMPVGEVTGRLRVRAMLDYPERLDVETLERGWEIEMDGERGSIGEPGALSVERAP